MALAGETLYVADTENHLIRKIDLAAAARDDRLRRVGRQGRDTPPFGRVVQTAGNRR